MKPERGMKGEREHPAQLSFLSPEDALMVHLMRRFMAEASRIYETKTGKPLEDALQISSPRDAYEFLRVEMEQLEQEQLRTINLNTKNRIISTHLIYQGTANETHIPIAEVFRPAVIENATALVVAHNHPSGDPSPSPEDVTLTRDLEAAGKLLGVEVLDHVIIGRGRFVSLKERRLGFNQKEVLRQEAEAHHSAIQ